MAPDDSFDGLLGVALDTSRARGSDRELPWRAIRADRREDDAMTSIRCCLLAVAGLATSCGAAIHFDAQEWTLRYRAEADALDVLVVSHGVHASGRTAKALQSATDDAKALVEGRRRVVVDERWLFGSFDLDRVDDAEGDDPLALEWRRWLPNVSVRRSGIVEEEPGEPALFQLFRVESVTAFLALVDRSIDRAVLEEGEEGLAKALDVPTAKAWVARASSDAPWIELRDGKLAFDAPASSPVAARLLADLFGSAAGSGETAQILRDLTALLASVQLGGGKLAVESVDLASGPVSVRFVEERAPSHDDGTRIAALLEDEVESVPTGVLRELVASLER